MNRNRITTMSQAIFLIQGMMVAFLASTPIVQAQRSPQLRIATFNVSLNRNKSGELFKDLQSKTNPQARKIAEIIQRIRPDILLINEFDFDPYGATFELFHKHYLQTSQNGKQPIEFPHHFLAPVNTGLPSGFDLDNDGKSSGPGDAYGFGRFPGQYGMVVLSKYPIDRTGVRTFREFLWKDMPGSLLPKQPETGEPFYLAEELNVFRLSSKSHWDIPIRVGSKMIHLLCCHPTPPVFDGKEDRNGCRNHDEIRLFADYISRNKNEYLYDDNGQKGGLGDKTSFVIAGDLNSDPIDGDSHSNAIGQLLKHARVHQGLLPKSKGAVIAAENQKKANLQHRGDPALDTSDFDDRQSGNLRIDYVLPSNNLKLLGSGVFWPKPIEDGYGLVDASDHRLVWIDIGNAETPTDSKQDR